MGAIRLRANCLHIRYPHGSALPCPQRTHSGLGDGPVSPDRDLGAETFTRDELECPAQGELFRVLGRCLSLNQNASAFFSDHEMPDAAVSCLSNSLLDLLDKSYHELTLLRRRHDGTLPTFVTRRLVVLQMAASSFEDSTLSRIMLEFFGFIFSLA